MNPTELKARIEDAGKVDSPQKQLILAIILQTILDMTRDKTRNNSLKQEANRFYRSDRFDWCMKILGLDRKSVNKIMAEQKKCPKHDGTIIN